MEEDLCGDAAHDEDAEPVRRAHRRDHAREDEHAEGRDERRAAEESPLLADGRKNVVRVRFRHRDEAEFELRVRRLESLASDARGADRDERLVHAVARPARVHVRVEERHHAVSLVRLQPEIHHERHDRQPGEQHDREPAQRQPCEVEHREDHRCPRDRHAEIRLLQNERHRGRGDDSGAEDAQRCVPVSRVAEKKRDGEDAARHRELAWLECRQARQLEPALCVLHLDAELRVRERDERDAPDIQRHGQPFRPAKINQRHHEKYDDADTDEHRLALPVARSRVRIRRAVDEEHSCQRDRHDRREEQPVHPEKFSQQRSHWGKLRVEN